jgi:hypothetical protein
MRKKK